MRRLKNISIKIERSQTGRPKGMVFFKDGKAIGRTGVGAPIKRGIISSESSTEENVESSGKPKTLKEIREAKKIVNKPNPDDTDLGKERGLKDSAFIKNLVKKQVKGNVDEDDVE